MSSVQDSTIIPWDTLNTFSALLLWFLCAFAYNDQHLWLPSKDSPGLLAPLFLPRQLKAPESWLPLCPSQGNFRWGLMESVKVQLLLQKCWGIICTKSCQGIRLELRFYPNLTSVWPLPLPSCAFCTLLLFSLNSTINYLLMNPCLRVCRGNLTKSKQPMNLFILLFIVLNTSNRSGKFVF